MDNIDDIAAAIQEISANRELYVDSLRAFLNECIASRELELNI